MCQKCDDLGYIEVSYDDGEYVEGCSVCNLGTDQIDKELRARKAALEDGYILSDCGRVLDFKNPSIFQRAV